MRKSFSEESSQVLLINPVPRPQIIALDKAVIMTLPIQFKFQDSFLRGHLKGAQEIHLHCQQQAVQMENVHQQPAPGCPPRLLLSLPLLTLSASPECPRQTAALLDQDSVTFLQHNLETHTCSKPGSLSLGTFVRLEGPRTLLLPVLELRISAIHASMSSFA